MTITFTLAVRYLSGRKLRAFLTTLAVIFGVAVIFGLNSYLPTALQAFERNLLSAAGKVDLLVTTVTNDPFDPAALDKVRSIEGIAAATPSLTRAVALPADKYAVNAITIDGLDPETAGGVRSYPILKGRFLKAGDGDVICLGEDLAKKLKLDVGDTFTVPSVSGTARLRVVGLLSTPVLPGVEQVYVPLTTAQKLFGVGDQINLIEAKFSPGADRGAIERTAKSKLGSGFKLSGLESGTELFASIQTGQFALNIFGVLALAMGGFIILNTFRTVVAERRHDIGMLRALGASRREITGIFLAESLLQGIVGTAVGLVVGYGLTWAMVVIVNPLYEQYLHFKIGTPIFTPGIFAVSVALGLGVTVLSAVVPAVSASRLMPLEALRPVLAEAYERASRWRALAGVIILVVAVATLLPRQIGLAGLGAVLFLVGMVLVAPVIIKPITDVFGGLINLAFAREGRIAQSSLTRHPGRAGITVSAMMIGLAIVVALAGMTTSIFDGFMGYVDKSMGSDFLILPQSLILSGNVGAGPGLTEAVRKTPGIGIVTSLRVAGSKTDNTALQVVGMDPDSFSKLATLVFSKGGKPDDILKLKSGRTIIANGIFAAQHGVNPGAMLTLATPEGPKRYRVVAVGSDYLSAKISTVFMSQANLARDFHTRADIMLMANLAPGADAQAAEASLKKTLRNYPAFTLYSVAQWRSAQRSAFNASMGLFYFLIAVLALPSLLALINTLVINVVSRTREIGMLRAVGSTRRQVRRMILAESLLLASIGTAFGILAGLWLGYVFVGGLNSSGFAISYYFPYSGILMAVAVGLIFGVVASLLPARQAARLDIVQALHYE